LNSDSEETDYDEKVLQLAANKKDQEYKTRKIEEMDQETIDLVDKLKEIEDKMEKIDSDLKKTYGNTNLKNDRGDYLN
jgi:septal ring factor EnvC (AmiA/AmiB activator)